MSVGWGATYEASLESCVGSAVQLCGRTSDCGSYVETVHDERRSRRFDDIGRDHGRSYSEAFKATVKAANDAGKLVASVRLNSPSGNLLEGAKLADAVRFGKLVTNVGHGATCASACFLIFAAGQTKFANYSAQIGVHGASDESGAETVQSGAATVSMARIAKDLGVPPAIIGRMVVTPPSEMVWLSPSDFQSMGTSMVGKPDQSLHPRNRRRQANLLVFRRWQKLRLVRRNGAT
jgi:hypothetical protein